MIIKNILITITMIQGGGGEVEKRNTKNERRIKITRIFIRVSTKRLQPVLFILFYLLVLKLRKKKPNVRKSKKEQKH